MDPKGKSHKVEEKPTEVEKERVDSQSPQKVIQAESKETQDFVRETLATSRGDGLCAERPQ